MPCMVCGRYAIVIAVENAPPPSTTKKKYRQVHAERRDDRVHTSDECSARRETGALARGKGRQTHDAGRRLRDVEVRLPARAGLR